MIDFTCWILCLGVVMPIMLIGLAYMWIKQFNRQLDKQTKEREEDG